MTVAVEALNQTIVDACDSDTYNDADGVDSVDFKQNSGSVYWTIKSDGNATFTPSASVDLSGTGVHVRFWGLLFVSM